MEEEKIEELTEEKVEEKKKQNNWIMILVLIIVLLLLGIGAIVFINKDKILSKDSKPVEEEKQKPKEQEPKEEKKSEQKDQSPKEESKEPITDIKKLSSIIFEKEKNHLEIDSIDKEKLIRNLAIIDQKNITTITGTRLKELALKYFNISNLELVDLTCSWDHNNQDTNVMYIYNPSTDKYEENHDHKGHGGGSTGISVYLVDSNIETEGDYTIYSAHLYYENHGCTGDTCGPLETLEIYYTYDDAINKTNRIMDAVQDESLCEKTEFGFKCDDDKIYEKIKDNTKIVKFYYKKINDNNVFEKYIVE